MDDAKEAHGSSKKRAATDGHKKRAATGSSKKHAATGNKKQKVAAAAATNNTNAGDSGALVSVDPNAHK